MAQRILALVHRRCARVIGESADGDVPALDTDNAFDDADIDPFTVEDRALFNM